jgi:hypothetical protein
MKRHAGKMSVDICKRSIKVINEARLGKNEIIVLVAIPALHV